MKIFFLTAICSLQAFSLDLSAQMSPEVERALQTAYAGDSVPMATTLQILNQASFPTVGYRTIALVQAYAASEKSEHLAEARRIAEEYVKQSAAGWNKDFVRVQLATVLALQGNRKDGAVLAEQILSDTNLDSFPSGEDPFLLFIAKRVRISPEQIPTYIRDNLHFQIGSYYLNREANEGGPDVQKAVNHFGTIVAQGLKESAMADQRLKGFHSSGLESSVNPRGQGREQTGNAGSSATSSDALKPPPFAPHEAASGASKEHLNGTSPRGVPMSSIALGIVIVLIVAATCLLGWWVKKRK